MLFGASGQLIVAGFDVFHGGIDDVGAAVNVAHGGAKGLTHPFDVEQQAAGVTVFQPRGLAQVPFADIAHRFGGVTGFATKPAQHAANDRAHQQCQRNPQGQQEQQRLSEAGVESVVDVVDVNAGAQVPVPARVMHMQ